MSEWLERIQEYASGYPPWLVLGVGVIVLGVLCIALSKIMRLLGWLLAIGGIALGAWLGWQHWRNPKAPATDPINNPFEHLMKPDSLAPDTAPSADEMEALNELLNDAAPPADAGPDARSPDRKPRSSGPPR